MFVCFQSLTMCTCCAHCDLLFCMESSIYLFISMCFSCQLQNLLLVFNLINCFFIRKYSQNLPQDCLLPSNYYTYPLVVFITTYCFAWNFQDNASSLYHFNSIIWLEFLWYIVISVFPCHVPHSLVVVFNSTHYLCIEFS